MQMAESSRGVKRIQLYEQRSLMNRFLSSVMLAKRSEAFLAFDEMVDMRRRREHENLRVYVEYFQADEI